MPHIIQVSTLFKQCSASDYFLAQVDRISVLTAARRWQGPSLPCFHPASVHWALYQGPCTALCTEDATKSKKGWSEAWGEGQFKGSMMGAVMVKNTVRRENFREPQQRRDEFVGQVLVLLHPTPFPIDPVRSPYEIPYSLLVFSIPTTHVSFSPSIPGN